MRDALLIFIIIAFCACNQGRSSLQNKEENTVGAQENSHSYTPENNFDQLVQEYEDPDRVSWQNPDLVIESLGDLNGKTIADIGAGSGYFTFRIIEKAEKVIAIDIDQRFIELIEERKSELKKSIASRLETRLTKADDPSLTVEEADIILIVNTYINIANRVDYLKKLKKGLKAEGKIVIVDFKRGDIPTGPPDEIKIDPAEAKEEIYNAGFKEALIDSISLKYQYIIVAQ